MQISAANLIAAQPQAPSALGAKLGQHVNIVV